jgi:glycosyltransferase involved in cell wall biosynthesis
VLRDATAVLFTSEQERRLARRSFWLYRCDEFVMNYGTAGPSGDPAAQRTQFSEKFPELAGKRQILFLGRVHPKKGADLLFEAFARLLREQPAGLERCQIVMAGPSDNAYGDEMKELAEKLGIADRITWTGMLTGDLKWGAYYNADVFVLPSHQENFGISVAEALACGVPVLISNEVNIWREICSDGAGLADADDAEGTFRLLSKWATLSADDIKALRASARQCFLKRFHVERAADALVRAMGEFGVR